LLEKITGTQSRPLRSCRRVLVEFDKRTENLYVNVEGVPMPTETSYTELRQNLASYLDRVVDDREVVVVKRRGARDVAIIAADELAGLEETAYLLRSPANARRLLESLRELDRGKGAKTSVDELRRSIFLKAKHSER
jgi:antitoxin YefM